MTSFNPTFKLDENQPSDFQKSPTPSPQEPSLDNPEKLGAKVILDLLEQEGIKYIWGVPGRESEAILFNENKNINLILPCVENTAGFAAYSYAQITGKTQVVFTTIGPGAANIANVIYSACADRVPLIFMTSQVETDRIFHNHTHQCIEAVAMYKPITKYAYEVNSVEEIEDCLKTAFEITQQEPKGPALISVPIDILKAIIDFSKSPENVVPMRFPQDDKYSLSISEKTPNINDIPKYIQKSNQETQSSRVPFEINQVLNLIANCKHPLLYVANEVVRSKAVEEVQKLCEEYQIPAIFAYDTKGVLPSNHPLNYFTCTSYAEGVLGLNPNEYLFPKEVDCIICLGYDYKDDVFPDKHFRYGEKQKSRLLINFSGFMPSEISQQFDCHVKGNLKTNIIKLLEGLKERKAQFNPPYDISLLREAMSKKSGGNYQKLVLFSGSMLIQSGFYQLGSLLLQDSYKIDVIEVIETINKHSALLVSDVGTYRHYAVLFSEISKPNHFITSAGSSSFGTGVPFGLGAALAHQGEKKRIIVLTGDGGFNTSIGDLRTLKKNHIDIVIIVLNNNKNGLINIYQQKGHNGKTNSQSVDHAKADFVAIAKGYECEAVKVFDPFELDNAIKDAFDKGGPWVIEVPIYYPKEDVARLTRSKNLG